MVLDAYIKQKRMFNEYNKKDLLVVKYFFENYSWGPDCCPFVLEAPYVSIPDMIKDKLVFKTLKIEREVYEDCY